MFILASSKKQYFEGSLFFVNYSAQLLMLAHIFFWRPLRTHHEKVAAPRVPPSAIPTNHGAWGQMHQRAKLFGQLIGLQSFSKVCLCLKISHICSWLECWPNKTILVFVAITFSCCLSHDFYTSFYRLSVAWKTVQSQLRLFPDWMEGLQSVANRYALFWDKGRLC